MAIAGVITYILFPAAPPWLAGQEGYLHEIQRTTGKGWEIMGVGTSVLFNEGQSAVNLTAAVPSLHAAFTMLVALFIWPRLKWRWARPLLLLYPAAMAITLMATGRALLLRRAGGLALRGHGDGRLGGMGTPPRHRLGPVRAPPRARADARAPVRGRACQDCIASLYDRLFPQSLRGDRPGRLDLLGRAARLTRLLMRSGAHDVSRTEVGVLATLADGPGGSPSWR